MDNLTWFCGQRGCEFSQDDLAHHADDKDQLCPICANPLFAHEPPPVAGEHDDTLPSETERPV